MFLLLRPLFELLAPLQVPICFCFVWGLILMLFWNAGTGIRAGIETLKRLHQIPCVGCEFFTGDYHLKCTVRPSTALSEEAIDCPDFAPCRRRTAREEPPIWLR
ncbi:hypothetical protein [Leptolyngbya sp. FACHB-261]|uniref:hypothetical protein n=1 Tax=Leptolyngbya sp. FACHB-261 TaxID=2692806 RepID=UPI00168607D6|nr:hypothetical protein [Leptolyngbya sp. FACHB-261]MBD2101584.1 hypothetical protein [Leptolyngbya sp. FACHB-261]